MCVGALTPPIALSKRVDVRLIAGRNIQAVTPYTQSHGVLTTLGAICVSKQTTVP